MKNCFLFLAKRYEPKIVILKRDEDCASRSPEVIVEKQRREHSFGDIKKKKNTTKYLTDCQVTESKSGPPSQPRLFMRENEL